MSYLNQEGDLRAKKEIPKAKLVFPTQESAKAFGGLYYHHTG